MTSVLDLEPFSLLNAGPLVAIGWLGRGDTYAVGETPADVFEKLTALAEDAWQPFAAAGRHECELCQYEPARLSGEVYVPGRGCIYAAPHGILHYIAAHWYRPPDAFVAAVLECPPMQSMAYKRALLVNGGRRLLAAAPGP